MACSWSLSGHSQLPEDQGGTRGRAPCGPTPEGLALAQGGSAEELRTPSLFRGKENFSRPEDLFCTKWVLVYSCWRGGAM